MMVFVFGVAFGLSFMKIQWMQWTEGLLAAATAWIALGLINEFRDLWSSLRGRTDLSGDERWGWRFAVFWRVAVVCLLMAHYGILLVTGMEWLDFPEHPAMATWSVGPSLREAAYFVCLVIVLTSAAPRLRRHRSGRRSLLLHLAGGAGAVVFIVMICWHHTIIQFLVAIAIQGIEMSHTGRFPLDGVHPIPSVRTYRFFLECCLAVGLGLLSLIPLCQLAREWSRGPRRRWIWGALLVTTATISASYLAWIFWIGFPRAFPIVVEGQQAGPLHVWITAVLVVGVLATAATYRLVASTGEDAGNATPTWRRRPQAYYHERPAVIVLLGVAIAAEIVDWLWAFRMPPAFDWSSIAIESLTHGPFLLRLAVLLLAVHTLLRLCRRKLHGHQVGIPRLSPWQFLTVWLGVISTAAVLIPSLIMLGFAVWFSPWYRVAWP
jgi:hypothetical protein